MSDVVGDVPESARSTSRTRPYDPWADLRVNWPEIRVLTLPMSGRLLGWLDYPVIALRSGTTAAQRRCTLAHEIVHLERGVTDCGPWWGREERQVSTIAARRLIDFSALLAAVRDTGGGYPGALAQFLDVDLDTLRCRLAGLSRAEQNTVLRVLAELAVPA